MSGQFINDWAQRITNKETLLVRLELINIIHKNNLIKTSLLDQHWNDNLLLPNFIEEKKDNWDIDIFLYVDNQEVKTETIVNILHKEPKILKINKNDKVWSFLLESNIVWKKIQIDLHIIQNSKNNLSNYFNYYRIPYLHFIFWMIFRKLNIKLWIKWLFYVTEFEKTKIFFILEEQYIVFLEKLLKLDIERLNNINSYKDLGNFIASTWLTKYDFFNFEKMKGKYLRKMRHNKTLLKIIEDFWTPSLQYEDYKNEFSTKLKLIYPMIDNKIKKLKTKIFETKRLALERRMNLSLLFNVNDLKDLTLEQKQFIPKIKNIISELLILKEVSQKLDNHYKNKKELFLVWGWVRDILLWIWNKDWDLSWNYTSEEFLKVIWWNITEKFWTVFVDFKWLKIEYTPYRKESNYDWRKPGKIDFNTSLLEDSKRRDFTINSLYLNISNLKIIDLHNWISDLNNCIVKTVWNSDERFTEDYLRILRWIRLSAKIKWKIEKNTYKSMIKLSKNINKLSDERITEEFFKGFSLSDNLDYLIRLDRFWNDSKMYINILKTYKNLHNDKIYSILYYLLDKNINRFKALPWKFSWKTKKLFIFWHKFLNIEFPSIDEQSIKSYLYDLGTLQYTRKEITKLLIIIWNLKILNKELNKKKLKEIIQKKKMIDKEKQVYTLIQLKESWIDIKEEIEKNNISTFDIKKYLKEKYIMK